MAQVTITQDNAQLYIDAGLINPKGKINFGGTRTINGRTDNEHDSWLYLEDALKQGRTFSFTANINKPLPTSNRKVATTTEDFVVEAPRVLKPKENEEWYGLKNFKDTFGISLKEATSYLPWIGDGIDIYDSAVDASKGDYSTAGITLAGMLVPNVIEKPLKGLWKWGKNAYLARKLNKSIGTPSATKLTPKTVKYTPTKEDSGKLYFYERPSKLTEAERAGDPKIKRNQQEPKKLKWSGIARDYEFPTNYEYTDVRTRYNKFDKNYSLITGGNKQGLENWKFFIDNLELDPSIPLIDNPNLISDYKRYLNNLGYDIRYLSDEQISKLLTHLYLELTKNQTGKLKGTLLYHSGPMQFDLFDFTKTGTSTGNMGYVGPGNYFSTGRTPYGLERKWDELSGERWNGNIQPYLITNISSTPTGHDLANKGLIPKYISNSSNFTDEQYKNIIKQYPELARLDRKDVFDEWYKKYYIPELNNNWKFDTNSFILDDVSFYPNETMVPLLEGLPIRAIEGMIHRNTGIKSLFPHPSTLVQDANGNWFIKRNWSDPRVNYKRGGKLISKKNI